MPNPAEATEARVILNGIDTLELHSSAHLAPRFVAQLEALKVAAQKTPPGEALPTWKCAGIAFTVSPRASQRGQYLLEAPEALAVSVNPHAPKGLPTVSIECRALRLWQHGADATAAEAEEVASVLTLGEEPDLQVSRIDVTADWQGWRPTQKDLDRITTRARVDTSHRVLREFTGWTFGTSAVRGRMYDKTEEIRGTDKASWMPELWAEAGTAYDPQTPVWRLEGQVRREALRELQDSVEDAEQLFKRWTDCRRCLPSLWDYLWGDWLSLRLPRTGKQRRRLDPRWASLVSGADWSAWDVAASVPLARVAAEAKFTRTLDQLGAYLARGIAERWALQGYQGDVEKTAWQLLNEATIHLQKKRDSSLSERAEALYEPMKQQLAAESERRKDRQAKGLDDADQLAWEAWRASRQAVH